MPTVAACQIDVRIGEIDANLDTLDAAFRDAARRGAALAIAPECAVTGYAYDTRDEAAAVARQAGPLAVERLAAAARELSMAVIAGTLEADGDALYNTALICTPDHLLARYRKTHLPFLGADRFVTPGAEPPPVVELAGMRVGVLICYDLRFPEAARVCALDGADVIALPTNWPVGVEFHPDLFAPARANENHCFLVAADRIGVERGVTFMGRSLILNPNGRPMARAGDHDPEVISAEIDVERARQTHMRMRPGEHEFDTIADRRPDLYARVTAPATDRRPMVPPYQPDRAAIE
ncbi:MAG: carbon-nitrogen hydrolase family protein [Chloroflexota bacterium]|nr:carbon-nitrogen hydrolase family protein [Chloroflexota bacterium]